MAYKMFYMHNSIQKPLFDKWKKRYQVKVWFQFRLKIHVKNMKRKPMRLSHPCLTKKVPLEFINIISRFI